MKICTLFRKLNKYLKVLYLDNICENVLPNARTNRRRIRLLKRLGVQIEKPIMTRKGLKVRIGDEKFIIKKGVSLGPEVLLDARKGLEIGENSVIAYQAIIWSLNHDYNDVHFKLKGGKVQIGKYTWVCSRAIILPGITIGDYSIVASGAIVTKDVPPYAIVAGIPAKIVGWREKNDYNYGYRNGSLFEKMILL